MRWSPGERRAPRTGLETGGGRDERRDEGFWKGENGGGWTSDPGEASGGRRMKPSSLARRLAPGAG